MKKLYIITGSLIVIVGLACIILLLIPDKKKDKEVQLSKYSESEDEENIEISTTEESDLEEENWELLEDGDDIIIVDFTHNIENNENKDKYISEITQDVSDHIKYIFNYQGYTEEYQSTLESNICPYEYDAIRPSYVEEICRSFEDRAFRSESLDVKIYGIDFDDGDTDKFTASIIGYIKVKASSNKIDEGEYIIPFNDHIDYESGKITRFYTEFNYVYKVDGFECYVEWRNDIADLHFKGTSGYPFNLRDYDPAYDEIQEMFDEQEQKYNEGQSSATDAEEE